MERWGERAVFLSTDKKVKRGSTHSKHLSPTILSLILVVCYFFFHLSPNLPLTIKLPKIVISMFISEIPDLFLCHFSEKGVYEAIV